MADELSSISSPLSSKDAPQRLDSKASLPTATRLRGYSGDASGTSSPTYRSLERMESKTSRRRSVTLSAKFLKSKSNVNSLATHSSWKDRSQQLTARLLKSPYISNFMVFVVLFDAYCTCSDIDSRAADVPTPQALMIASDICLFLYTLELMLNFWVKGCWQALSDWTLLLDVVIIACGYADLMVNLVANSDFVVRIGVFRAFRLARIVRLMRLLRKTRALRELQKLVTMMATCLKALLWSFVFCFLIMSVWAMFMVEVVHPLINDPDSPVEFMQDCGEYCFTATRSVMDANLLLFKTVIAGDSWGEIAVPVIRSYPFTAIIFVGSLLTLVFGVLNLIVAVVVDTFAEARQRDILNLAEELEYDFEKDNKFLKSVFDRIDTDGSGLVTFEELIEGARRDPAFQSRLRVMDIDEADLKQLFEMIDVNEQGYINADEFIAPLSRWVHDSKTAPRFIKYNLQRTMHQQEELFIFCQDCFNALAERLDQISEHIEAGGVVAPVLKKEEPSARSSMRSSVRSDARSDMGSLASEGSQLDWQRPPEAEVVEQPNASRKVKVTVCEADELTVAMESLEKFVLSATENALKKSMALVGSSIKKRLGSNFTFTPRERSRVAELPKKNFYSKTLGNRNSSSDVNSTASVSWAMGAVSKQVSTTSHGIRAGSKETKARRVIGAFGTPRRKDEQEEILSAKQAILQGKSKMRDTHRSSSF